MEKEIFEKANKLKKEIDNLKSDINFLEQCRHNKRNNIDIEIRTVPNRSNLCIVGKSSYTIKILTDSELKKLLEKLIKLEKEFETL